jgi:hypothetical protein
MERVGVYVVRWSGGGRSLRVESPPYVVLHVIDDVDDGGITTEVGVVVQIHVEVLDGRLRLVLYVPRLATASYHARPDLRGGPHEGAELTRGYGPRGCARGWRGTWGGLWFPARP